MLFWYREALIVFTSFSNQEVFEKEQSICAAEEQPTEDGVSEEWMFLLVAKENFLSALELLIVCFASIFFPEMTTEVYLELCFLTFKLSLKCLKYSECLKFNKQNKYFKYCFPYSKEMSTKLRAKDGSKRIKEPRKLQNQRKRSHWKRNLCHLHCSHQNSRSKNKLMG